MDAPEELRARAVSLWFVASVGLGPFGGYLLGWLADRVGLRPTVTGAAVYGVVVAVLMTLGARGRAGRISPYPA